MRLEQRLRRDAARVIKCDFVRRRIAQRHFFVPSRQPVPEFWSGLALRHLRYPSWLEQNVTFHAS